MDDSPSSWCIPGYEARELVGFGASGEVWRGRDMVSGEDVALKRLRVPDDAANARLRREAALLAALSHPHLLRLRDTVRTGDGWVLVLDYAAGSSLAALLRERGRLRPGEVVTALAPLAAALAYAHGEGLVHGDVTPANVLFTADGRPLLADLGIARVVCDDGPIALTPEYADPAVAAGAMPGPATDVFAVAAVAWHALTGMPPWAGETAEDTLFAAATGELPDLRELAPGAPEPLVAVLERALSVDPAARGSAAELALDLRHACTPEPVELGARPTTVPAAARPIPLTHEVRSRPAPDTARHRRATGPGRPRRTLSAIGRGLGSKGLRAAVLGVISVAVAVRLGIAWAGADTGSHAGAATGDEVVAATDLPATTPTPSAAAPADRGWIAVLDRLDASRRDAFAAGDATRLATVYTPGSAALTGDTRQIEAAGAAGVRAVNVHHEITALRVVSAGRARVGLDVTERLAGYQLRQGDRVEQRAAGAARRYRVTLAASGQSWRIASLVAAS